MSIAPKKITGHIKSIAFLFCLPLIVLAVQKNTTTRERVPASHKHKKLKYNKQSIKVRQAAKSNSTFGIELKQEVLSHNSKDSTSELKVELKFEAYITTEAVIVKWVIPEGIRLTEGKIKEEFHSMRPGELNSTSISLSGDVFRAKSAFVEIYSMTNGTKLGAVNSIKLRPTVSAHISSINGDVIAPDKRSLIKTENKKKYKLIY